MVIMQFLCNLLSVPRVGLVGASSFAVGRRLRKMKCSGKPVISSPDQVSSTYYVIMFVHVK